MLTNDRLKPFSPTVGAFRRRSMSVKWLSCKSLIGIWTWAISQGRLVSGGNKPKGARDRIAHAHLEA